MGVDYSSTIGWGVAVTELPDTITNGEWFGEEEAIEWLDKAEFNHIEYRKCGDWMNGEYVHLFYLVGTEQTIDYRFGDGFISFEDPNMSPEVGQEFQMLCELLDIPWPTSLSWKLIFNVS